MYDIFLWVVVVIGYSVAIYCVFKVYIFSFSLFRDAPYVPIDRRAKMKMFEYLDLCEGDSFVDIGSGDGTVVFSAAKILKGKGRFVGVEMSKSLVFNCNIKKLFSPYRKNIHFTNGNAFEQEYSSFNKVYIYMTTNISTKLVEILNKQIKKGARVVSVMFSIGDEFIKSHKVEVKSDKIGHKIWKYYIWNKQ